MKRQCDRVRDGELVAYLANPDDESLRDVHAHVVDCEECASELRAWRALRGDIADGEASRPAEHSAAHPAEENLMAYCDDPDSVGPVLRTEIQAHLAVCGSCRDETRVLTSVRLENKVQANARAGAGSDLDASDRLALDATFDVDDDDVLSVDLERASIPSAAVIESMTLAQRMRRPGAVFALFLALSLPVIGMYAIESGVVLQSENDTLAFRQTGSANALEVGDRIEEEIELDPATGTARLRRLGSADGDTLADRKHGALAFAKPITEARRIEDLGVVTSAPLAQVAPGLPALPTLPAPAPQETSEAPAPQGRGAEASLAATAAARGDVARQQAAKADVPIPAAAKTAVETPVEEPPLPLSTHREQRLTPEQLMAILRTERHVKDLERTAIEIPEADGTHVRTGAAVIETSRGDTDRSDDSGEVARSTRLAPESMILGVRQIGRAPIRGEMLGSAGADDSPQSDRSETTRRPRVHFVRGSSYVFTTDEIVLGLEVRFPLPMLDGVVRGLDARLFEVDSSREIRRSFAPPADAAQSAPMVSLDVPPGWLYAGRYSVELIEQSEAADSADTANRERAAHDVSRINIRILDSPTARSAGQ